MQRLATPAATNAPRGGCDMKVTAILIWMVIAGAALIALDATVHVYVWTGQSFMKAGTMQANGQGNYAIVCVNKECEYRGVCEKCHTASDASRPYANQPLHERAFSSQALSIGATPVAMDTMTVVREGTGLILRSDSGARIARLPADALVVRDRSGRPSLITYRGDAPPRP
jgi:hypothetical protein